MNLSGYFEQKFPIDRKQWEENLLKELKITEIGNKTSKKLINGSSWPTLSLESKQEVQLSSAEWKKASTTFATLEPKNIENEIELELSGGVRNFFFQGPSLNLDKWQRIEKVLAKFKDAKEIEVFILDGKEKFTSSKIKVISNIISGKAFQSQGSDSVLELALLAKNFIDEGDKEDSFVGVYVDSMFFHNIAKIRATRMLLEKIQAERKSTKKFKIVALTSYEEWTLYERYSNMLRNETAVAAAYIGGADHIQSAGYNTLYELEINNPKIDDHFDRSQRMGRNTSHILALESMLGVVGDAAFGSYHLENLTLKLCEEAWPKMQALLNGENLEKEVLKIQETKLQMIKTRKLVLSGINDYPDAKETLNVQLKDVSFFRVARIFESLRLQIEGLTKKPEVSIVLFGDFSALNGRLNFIKNYFELLGLTVHGPDDSNFDFNKDLSKVSSEIVIICAQDDDYAKLSIPASSIKTKHKFIGGKVEMPGFTNLFAGQNVYDLLASVVKTFVEKA